ncbi:MAG: Fe-S cluster assembly iron-binding protein IscA [Candidatus Krumholzibacteriia bacterium]|jgi:Fe-S cluster assembly iron-binding protein IscA
MALDEPKEEDAIVEQNGIKFVLDVQTSEVLEQSGGLNIDYVNEEHQRGYMLKLGNPGGDCGSGGCSSGGCG